MKRCPNCQKSYDDDKRFCQVDGTPLVTDAPEISDPYKTVVGGSFSAPSENPPTEQKNISEDDDDILQVNDFDPMKTVVAGDFKREEPQFLSEREDESVKSEFSEPSMNPPSFGDLSGTASPFDAPKPFEPNAPAESAKPIEPPKFDSPFSANASPPSFNPPPVPENKPFENSPFDSPKVESPNFGNAPSPFDPPPPYKQPPVFEQTPFGQPSTPFGQANDPFAPAQANEWTPPPAPVGSWQNDQINSNTPFNPPVAGTAGQNNTLAIVSLVCGILSICMCGLLTGIPALITGYMAKNNADRQPEIYGGRGMALAGMILGGVGTLFTILYIVYIVLAGAAGAFGR